MRFKNYLAQLFLVFLTLASSSVSAQNLVVNGDFSLAGSAGWTPTTNVGSPSLSIAPLSTFGGPGPSTNQGCDVNAAFNIKQKIPVQPNTAYALQFNASRNTALFGTAPPLALMIVTVQENSTLFLNVTKGYSQTTIPFCFEHENYFFITGATTDTVILTFKTPQSYIATENVVIDDISLVSTVACSGLPVAGSLVSLISSACFNEPFSIDLTGYSLESGISFHWETSPAGQNTWSAAASTGSNLVVQSQIAATDYRCKVTCGNSNQTVAASVLTINQNQLTDCYCVPQYTYGCAGYYMDDVYISGEAGSAINSAGTGCSTNAYDDRTGIDSVIIAQGGTYGVDISGAGYGEIMAWIDFDDDGLFQPSDLVGSSSGSSYFLPTNFSISVPAGAQVGVHRLRMRMASYGDPCGPGMYGETHDYKVRVVPPANCPAPAMLSTSLTTTSALLAWNQAGAVSQWQIEYGLGNFVLGTGTQILVGSNPYTLGGLNPNTAYKFRIRAICGPGDTSIWSNHQTFTTPTTCYTPVEAPATNVTTNSAELHWNQQGLPVTLWEIEYSAGGLPLGSGTRILVTNNPYTLTGLNQGTMYRYYVRSVCGPGDTSSWSTINIPFTTTVSCVAPYIPGSAITTGITTTSADVHWTQPGLATQWQISYDTGSFTPANGTMVMGGTNPFTLTGLIPGTVYRFYVRGICGPGDTSTWSNQSLAFITQCIPLTIPYVQDFEFPFINNLQLPICMYGHYVPNHWIWAATTSPGCSSCTPHSGSRYLKFYSGHTDTVYTAGIDLVAGNTYYFNCYYVTDGIPDWMNLSIVAGTTQDPSGYEATVVAIDSPIVNTTYQPLGGTFVPSTTGTYYFGIASESNNLYSSDLSVDDISVGTAPLAIRLSDIKATNVKSRNMLSWTTSTELQGDRFIIEHAADGKNFRPLESRMASGVAGSYSYWHNDPVYGTNYYRIKLLDANGGYSYSKTVTANLDEQSRNSLRAVPNPTTGKVMVTMPAKIPGSTIIVSDIYGRRLLSFPVENKVMEVDLSALAAGEYFMSCPGTTSEIVKISRL